MRVGAGVGGSYMPTMTLMSAWFEAFFNVRPDDMKWMERGRRTIVATAMRAGWYGKMESSGWGGGGGGGQ